MNQQPNRGTRQLVGGAKTTGFGDTFVASNDGAQPQRTTRPLKMPPHMLKDAVPARIADTKRDLDYVRHLVDLFRPHINVFRFAETLITMPEEAPEEPEAFAESLDEDFEDFEASPPSGRDQVLAEFKLTPEKQDLAERIYERILTNPKLRQRVQIAIHQYTEAESNYQKAVKSFGMVVKSTPETAWDLMDEMAIERLKGKAYAICGFYDNFKDDPILGRVFPPPNQQAQKPRLNTNSQQAPQGQTRPLQQQPQAQPKKQTGLLDGIKGIFGMK